MRVLFTTVIIVLLTGTDTNGDDVFGKWGIFPGPNPEAADLLPDADPDTVFRIGQIIFEYPLDRLARDAQPINELSKLMSVADAVKTATPSPALVAIVQQQLITPHEFHFVSASVSERGNAGFMWDVTYELFPKEGGFSGIPYRYRAVLDGHGNLISPQFTVFDAFFHSPEEGWTYSVLPLPTSPTAKDATLSAEKIRISATESLAIRTKPENASETARSRMEYDSQKRIRFPVATDATGAPIHVEVWAVNFRDPSLKERSGERLTVWVTEDGRTAEVRHLDHSWYADEQSHSTRPAFGSDLRSTRAAPVR